MFKFLKNLFKPKKPVKHEQPRLTRIETKVVAYLRKHRPSTTAELHAIIEGRNLNGIIKSLRNKGFVIEMEFHAQNTTYLIRNRKCR